MRYTVLASDYDGTLAHDGVVDQPTLDAVDRLLKSGRKLLLVTGRELDDLKRVFPQIDRCELVVAENGGLLFNPKTREERSLAEPPNPQFVNELTRRGVPFSVGRGIVATWEPHQTTVLEVIQQLGLELQLSFNKGSVMVLPSGINKQTGLQAALDELGLSPHNVVGIGDAENDHIFLSACECAVAVANALPALKERADLVTNKDHGAGASELIDRLIADDLRSVDARLTRHAITVANRSDGEPVTLQPYRGSLLFAGPSGSGKSTAATGVLESLAEQKYQFCLVDPEGDYENFMGAVQLGTPQAPPEVKQVLKTLEAPKQNLVVNLLGIPVPDRPVFFASLFAQILDLRARTARPHWLIIDEAHHMLSSLVPTANTMPQAISGMIYITVHPEHIAKVAFEPVEIAVAVGNDPEKTLGGFAQALEVPGPPVPNRKLQADEGIVWCRTTDEPPFVAKLCIAKSERRRHLRKYAEGELGPDRSFFFRGPENKLNLKAHNLQVFNTMAEGVDDETWTFHLRKGEYSNWLREAIKDPELADEVAAVERDQAFDSQTSRRKIIEAIERRYTAAA
jgi:hydroxymethylpyrimidine pyrophosphatase-like HAD family hydrolase